MAEVKKSTVEKQFLLIDFCNEHINGPYNMLALQSSIEDQEKEGIALGDLSVIEVGTGKVYSLDKKITYLLKS